MDYSALTAGILDAVERTVHELAEDYAIEEGRTLHVTVVYRAPLELESVLIQFPPRDSATHEHHHDE